MDKPFIVVNPMAKNRLVGRHWDQYKTLLEAELGPFEFAMTVSETDAATITRKALREGYRNIGSLGGDGTNSLVLNGFFEHGEPVAPDATLSILPVGTGGDFRRILAVEGKDLRRYAQLMTTGEPVEIDIGHISYINHEGQADDRYFLNIASFGMGGLVDRLVNTTTKALGGKASFFIATLRATFRYQAPQVTLTLDGEPFNQDRIFVVAACNGQYFGGGMHIGPEASVTDGLLDVVVMPWRSRFYHLSRGTTVYKGTHVNLPGVLSGRGKVLRAESDQECLLDIDGEAPGRLPAEIRILPKAIRLKAPLR
ncbi:MAG: diacylglycerol kinase family lipid kinase [Bradymonadales bacterium]|nr:diacylglycerol kinase family lipid kinase [Bradymonadales bacterium]